MTHVQVQVFEEHKVIIGFLPRNEGSEEMVLKTISFSKTDIPENQWEDHHEHYKTMLSELRSVLNKYKGGPKYA